MTVFSRSAYQDHKPPFLEELESTRVSEKRIFARRENAPYCDHDCVIRHDELPETHYDGHSDSVLAVPNLARYGDRGEIFSEGPKPGTPFVACLAGDESLRDVEF